MDNRLTKVMKEQLADGLIRMPLKLREYVGLITGLSKEMDFLAEQEGSRSTDQVLAMHRKLREMDHKLDEHISLATDRLDVLKTSIDLEAHVAVILGYTDMLETMPEAHSEAWKIRQEHEQIVDGYVKQLKDDPEIVAYIDQVIALREEVALKMGLKSEMDEVATLPDRIATSWKPAATPPARKITSRRCPKGWRSSPGPSTAATSSTGPRTSSPTSTATCSAAPCSRPTRTTP